MIIIGASNCTIIINNNYGFFKTTHFKASKNVLQNFHHKFQSQKCAFWKRKHKTAELVKKWPIQSR